MLVSVGCTDKFDRRALPADSSQEKFCTIEASLYQVLHRTTANEPLRTANARTEGIRSVARSRGT